MIEKWDEDGGWCWMEDVKALVAENEELKIRIDCLDDEIATLQDELQKKEREG